MLEMDCVFNEWKHHFLEVSSTKEFKTEAVTCYLKSSINTSFFEMFETLKTLCSRYGLRPELINTKQDSNGNYIKIRLTT